jgi:hypothetical protein
MYNWISKRSYNQGDNRQPYFWQDNHGREIDCLLVNGEKITAIEIKSGKTISPHYFDNLGYWRALTALPEHQEFVVYGGDQTLKTNAGILVGWKDLDRIVE